MTTLDPCPEGYSLRWHPWIRRYICLPDDRLPDYEYAMERGPRHHDEAPWHTYKVPPPPEDYDPTSDWLDDPLPEELRDAGYPHKRDPYRQ